MLNITASVAHEPYVNISSMWVEVDLGNSTYIYQMTIGNTLNSNINYLSSTTWANFIIPTWMTEHEANISIIADYDINNLPYSKMSQPQNYNFFFKFPCMNFKHYN